MDVKCHCDFNYKDLEHYIFGGPSACHLEYLLINVCEFINFFLVFGKSTALMPAIFFVEKVIKRCFYIKPGDLSLLLGLSRRELTPKSCPLTSTGKQHMHPLTK